MGRRVEPLVAEALGGLPERCQRCLFWELGHPRPAADLLDAAAHPTTQDELAGDPCLQKQAWVTACSLESGAPGRVVRVGDEVVGFAVFAPVDAFAPRRGTVPRPSDEALLLATLWVEPAHREHGIARLLVHAAVKEAIHRDLKAVEVYGDRRHREWDCVVPTTWLLHEGFEVHREHPRYPLLRLSTKRTVRWAESIEHALEGLRERVPHLAPVPGQVGSSVPQSQTTTASRSAPATSDW
ncbi:MAG: GNAT family N-acetyltransferase [Actinomycetes bacterium]